MKRIATYLLPLLIFSSFTYGTISDLDFLNFLANKLDQFNQKVKREFVYLMLDKPIYRPGESIWIAAWITEGNHLLPTKLSEKLYVDLINPKGTIEKTLTLPIIDGRSNGDFELSRNIAGGIYTIRGYTYFSKNSAQRDVFEKEITVQKVSSPRLLMKVDFEKKAYGANDEVVADFEIKNLKNQPIKEHLCDYKVYINGELLKKAKEKTDTSGKVKIKFQLPEKLNSTDGILNIQIDYKGEKESISRSIPILLTKITLQFHPEGGQILAGAQNNIAFKALNAHGKPADFEAILVEGNNKIKKINSFYHGYGAFNFVPSEEKTYKVKITKPKDIQQEFILPKAQKNIHTFRVISNKKNKLRLNLHTPSKDSIYIVASVRNKIYYSKKIASTSTAHDLNISTKDWPSGIARLSMFNKEKNIVAERLIYTGSRTPMRITIEPDKKQYSPNDSIYLKIKTEAHDGAPISAKLALKVIDNKLLTHADDRQDNILSYLLMSNELQETIEDPIFYFEKNKKKAWNALDYVLMCSNLRRLSWLEIINNKPHIGIYPDNTDILHGRIVDPETNKGIKTKIWLRESRPYSTYNIGRMAHLTTTKNGYFTFTNVDPNSPVTLYAKLKEGKRLKIITETEELLKEKDFLTYLTEPKNQQTEVTTPKAKIKNNPKVKHENINIQDNRQKKTIRSIRKQRTVKFRNSSHPLKRSNGLMMQNLEFDSYGCYIAPWIPPVWSGERIAPQNIINLNSTFQSNVLGINAINEPNLALDTYLKTGESATHPNGVPLLVIDDLPIIANESERYEILESLAPNDVKYISVLKDASATSLFGNLANNGAIIIHTKKKKINRYYIKKRNLKHSFFHKEIGLLKDRTEFSLRRRFDAFLESNSNKQNNIRTTLLWEPFLHTDAKGEAVLKFKNSNVISSFKIIAEGISSQGTPGRGEFEYHTQRPFSISAKTPPFVCISDTVRIPIILTNNTNEVISGQMNFSVGELLTPIENPVDSITLTANSQKVIPIEFCVKNTKGKASIEAGFKSLKYHEKIKHKLDIVPIGFPVQKDFSGQIVDRQFNLNIVSPLKRSLKMKFHVYTDVNNTIISATKGLLREPNGCFEQTSSANYPNLLVLDYLNTIKHKDPKTIEKATELIARGYKRLISFEVRGGGFDWFGRPPAHEALTAYGLMQFHDMKNVYPEVSDRLIQRTAQWLMSRRNGMGSFNQKKNGYDTFRPSNKEIINAYIVYALSETGYHDVQKEFEHSVLEEKKFKDSYLTALVANSAFNLGNTALGNRLLSALMEIQDTNGSWTGKSNSITRSQGKSLRIETTSLICLAMLKSTLYTKSSFSKTINFLYSSRSSYGRFGSTQGTVLALKAITEYSKKYYAKPEEGTFDIYIDDKKIAEKYYYSKLNNPQLLDSLEKLLPEGKHKLRIRFSKNSGCPPYTLGIHWRTKTQQSSNESPLRFSSQLSSNKASVSDVVRLTATLINTQSKPQPMSLMKIGIPGGLSPQPWQLKELRDKGLFDYYEIFDNYLVFYFREMSPNEKKEIKLDLKAEMAGSYEGAASSAYLYYTDEYKRWQEGMRIKIRN